MRLKFFEPFIIAILLQLQIVQETQCEIVKLKNDEIYIQKSTNVIVIESDTNKYSDIEYFNYSIISQTTSLSYQDEGQIISSQIVDPINVEYQKGLLLCKFLKTEIYIISCIKNLDFYTEKQYFKDQIDSLVLNPQIQSDDICEQVYLHDHSEFFIFCFNLNMFNIYSVNFNNQTTLNLSYQMNLEEYFQCKRKYFKLKEDNYLLAFYKCKSWGVFSYFNNNLKIILDQQIIQKNEYTPVENIQVCLSRASMSIQLFLIMETGYTLYYVDDFNEITYNYFSEYPSKLKKVLFTAFGNVQSIVRYVDSVNKTFISKQQGQLEFIGTEISAYLFQGILFVQTQNELICYFNDIINQTIKINPSYFYFYDYYNLIQQVDIINKQINFYKFSFTKNILKPTKKYIFLISASFYYGLSSINCIEIVKIQQNDNVKRIVQFHNNCSNQTQLQLPKDDLALPFEYKILLPKSQDYMNIYDKYNFAESCPIIKKVHHIQNNLIYSNLRGDFFIMEQKRIQSIFCNGTSIFKLNIENYDVFYYQNYALQVNKQQRKLKFFNFQKINAAIIETKVGSNILKILQFKSYFLIMTQNVTDIIVLRIDFKSEVKAKMNMKSILFKLFQYSLSNNTVNQNQQINQQFFILDEIPLFIQFMDYLIVQLSQESKIYKIDNIQIVNMKTIIVRGLYYLLTVHLNRNEIIEYHFNLEQILILYTYTLDQYEIIRPLKYQINQQYFAIAVRNGKNKFIFIFAIYISKQIQLINTIKTNRLFFFFTDNQLVYYDDQDEITIFSLNNFFIQITNFLPFLGDRNFTFHINPLNQNQTNIEIEFQLKIYTLCYKIFNRNNNLLVKFPFSKSISLNIIDYFYGPINSVKILNQKNIVIKGPILFSKNIINYTEIESLKIKTIQLPEIFDYFYNKKQSIFVYLDDELLQMIPNKFKSKEKQGTVIVFQGKLQLLAYFEKKNSSFMMSILQLKENLSQFMIIKQLNISNLLIDTSYEDLIINTGNLILFRRKSNKSLRICFIIGTEVEFIENDQSLLQIIKVGGLNDFYISLKRGDTLFTNIFQIFTLKSKKFQEIGQIIINFSLIKNELKNYILVNQHEYSGDDQLIEFLECTLFQEEIKLEILQIFISFSVLAHIQINLQDFSFSYNVLKILRNSQDQTQFSLEYYGKNLLLLKSSVNTIYVYDLKEERKLHDYIGSFDLIDENFYPINTTHMLVYSDSGADLFIAESGYQIQSNEQNYQEENFILIAQNQVSEANLNVSIEASQINILNIDALAIQLWILFIFFLVLFLICFILRRLRLKQQQRYNNNRIEDYS